MPFKSEAQRKLFHAKADRGEISPKVVHEWEHATHNKSKLPEHVKKTAAQIADEVMAKLGGISIADEVLAKIAAGVAAFRASPAVGKKQLIQGMQKKLPPPEHPKSIEWRKSLSQKPKGEPEMLKFFSLKEAAIKEAAVDPEIMEAAALKSSSGGASKLWQGLTGLSDDVLMAGMNIKQKMERNKQREKHASQQLASSVSMLVKMSDVAKKEKLQGGKADGKSTSDFNPEQIAEGEKVEKEHTDDPAVAAEIASDHLEEIPDYYTRLKKMEESAPKAAQEGLLTEQPMQATSPMSSLPPDILQLLRVQALVDQSKTATPNDPGDILTPYQREQENEGPEASGLDQEQAARQAKYERALAEQMRAQRVEHEYTGKVRRGELMGAAGGVLGGGGLGALLSKPGRRFMPIAVGASLGGLLGKGLGRHVGQSQGLDYLKEYSGTPWAVQ